MEAPETSAEAFLLAVRKGDARAVSTMLDRDASLIDTRMDGATALHFAAWEDHAAVVDVLLDRGADIDALDAEHGMLPIAWANEHGHMDLVRHLHQRGASVPFQLAAAFGLIDEVSDRLREDPTVLNEPRGYGTALHFAALWGQPSVVRLLLDAGADPGLPNANGELAQAVARRQARPDARDTMLVVERRKNEIQRDCVRVAEMLEAHLAAG